MEYLSTLTAQQRDAHGVGDLMRLISCATISRSHSIASPRALEQFLDSYPNAIHVDGMRKALTTLQTKAAVAPGTTTDATWAAPLVIPRPLIDPLLALVQKESLLGRIVGLRPAPFHAKVPQQQTLGTFAWVTQNTPKPHTKIDFGTVTLLQGKIAGIVPLTKELVILAGPNVTTTMRDALVNGIVKFQDEQFLDPAVALVAGTNPASITNGVTPTTTTGDLAKDVAALLMAFYAASPNAQRPTLVMTPAHAGQLAAMGAHPALTATGGVAFGVPTVTTPGAGLHVVALDAAAVLYADGGIEIDVSEQATVDMQDTPVAPTAATMPTSLWQHNMVGIRVERMLWWTATPNSVQLLTVAA